MGLNLPNIDPLLKNPAIIASELDEEETSKFTETVAESYEGMYGKKVSQERVEKWISEPLKIPLIGRITDPSYTINALAPINTGAAVLASRDDPLAQELYHSEIEDLDIEVERFEGFGAYKNPHVDDDKLYFFGDAYKDSEHNWKKALTWKHNTEKLEEENIPFLGSPYEVEEVHLPFSPIELDKEQKTPVAKTDIQRDAIPDYEFARKHSDKLEEVKPKVEELKSQLVELEEDNDISVHNQEEFNPGTGEFYIDPDDLSVYLADIGEYRGNEEFLEKTGIKDQISGLTN